jgi:pyruvate dehydrogenase E2 component (dihydrolipoamide acetyltransferase)
MRALSDLIDRARTGGLRASELAEGTITVTSLGDRGVETVFGVIHPPQVALVGFGRIAPRPCSEGDAVVTRPMVTMTLSADHRASDGHRAARYLADVRRRLEEEDA